ncbi:hypothetical protein KDH10_003567 [Shewanella vesiculosa]|uniref:hypothetical protein n=1 Tax=Shewanella vesiculosa TaxID=518738 RepID=UPI0014054C5D|nr:hypothetical protein [Shewanella vesiculosa]UJL42393.1 hypothetical protein KDH10_003567 [Shewanella vesiculosa]
MDRKVCPTIVDLQLDTKSIEAINSINDILKTKDTGLWVTLIGQLLLIFGGLGVNAKASNNVIEKSLVFKSVSSDSSQTSYSIFSTNWEYFFKTFSSLDRFANNQIETIAGMQMLRSEISSKERVFWKSVHYGCKVK